MLHRIYVIRHGETVDFAQEFLGNINTPTGNHADVELSKVGIEQSNQTARRLTQENLPIDIVYSSPHYQCLDTLRPIVMGDDGKARCMVKVENGLREWEDIDDLYPLCTGQCNLKRPTAFPVLQQHFPYIDPNYLSVVKMPPGGWRCEPPRRLLLRVHFLLHHLILSLDKLRKPQTILLCTHAPIMLAIARVLTAEKLPAWTDYEPEYNAFFGQVRRRMRYISKVEFNQPDHHAGYCSISRFDRRNPLDWTWTLSTNGSQTHLPPSLRTGPWRFRPTPWQNRHSPHPILSLCSFIRHLPHSLLWGPHAVVNGIRNAIWELCTASERQLRNNPYRLPAWVYLVLWCCLITACVNRLMTMDAAAQRWENADGKSERHARVDWLDAFGNLCGGVVQFSLFMFPPLLA